MNIDKSHATNKMNTHAVKTAIHETMLEKVVCFTRIVLNQPEVDGTFDVDLITFEPFCALVA
jgi:hypothetical protein